MSKLCKLRGSDASSVEDEPAERRFVRRFRRRAKKNIRRDFFALEQILQGLRGLSVRLAASDRWRRLSRLWSIVPPNCDRRRRDARYDESRATGLITKINRAGRSNFMKRLQVLWAMLLVLSVSLPVCADQASSAYKQGLKAESENKYDEAFQAYSQAHALKPRDAKYFTAYTRVRFYAAMEHIKNAQALRGSGKLPEAAVEFQKAADIDHTNFVAKEEARR